jgi:hypothetical protein
MIDHPVVSALRYNTITRINTERNAVLQLIHGECGTKDLWMDYKTRQLRIAQDSDDLTAPVKISHKISVNTPTEVLFKEFSATVDEVREDEIVLRDPLPRGIFAGEPLNILAPSFEVEGFFTASDDEYMAAAIAMGRHTHMLSFVEKEEDILETLRRDPLAKIAAKIESRRGLDFVRNIYPNYKDKVTLMAAMDDLYINMGSRKHDMLGALELIIGADPDAIAASRILTCFEKADVVTFQDLTSLKYLTMTGFKTLLLSDNLCRDPYTSKLALDALQKYNELGVI